MAYRQHDPYGQQNNGYYDGPQSTAMNQPQEYGDNYGQADYGRRGPPQNYQGQGYSNGPGPRHNERSQPQAYGGYGEEQVYGDYYEQSSQDHNGYGQQRQEPVAPYGRGAPPRHQQYSSPERIDEHAASEYRGQQPQFNQRNEPYNRPATSGEQFRNRPAPQRSYSDNQSRNVERLGGPANNGPQSQNPNKQRILRSPTSPANSSWDNPFPTFPKEKKPVEERSNGSRPPTSASQKSHGSGRSHRGPSDPRAPGSAQPSVESQWDQYYGDNSGSRSIASRDGRPSMEMNDSRSGHYDRSEPMPNSVSERMLHSEMPIRGPAPPSHQQADPYQTQGPLDDQSSYIATPTRAQTFGSEAEYQQRAPYAQHSSQPSHASQMSYSGLIDHYYEDPNQGNHGRSRSTEEDMPNFDAAPNPGPLPNNGHAADKEMHIGGSQHDGMSDRGRPNDRGAEGGFAGAAYRSRSQPNLREGQQRDEYGHPQNAPPMPGMGRGGYPQGRQPPPRGPPPNAGFNDRPPPQRFNGPPNGGGYGGPGPDAMYGGRGGPGGPGPGRRPVGGPPPNRGPGGPSPQQRGPGVPPNGPPNGPVPGGRGAPQSPPGGRPQNPDALPEHPVPVRPGLMQQSTPPAMQKPPPVRNYLDNTPPAPMNNPPPQQAPAPQQQQPPQPPVGQPTPVTKAELDSLRQRMQANPSDQATDLLLAQKMVEAATVLAGEGGRADAKTRAKNRERYIMDAHKIVKKLVSRGYSDAMFYLADCHGSGQLGLAKDPKEAFNLYQSAAKLNHPQAAYRVAVCCELGQDEGGGTRRDPLKALQWYKRAATLGDAPAMYKLGIILLKGLLGQTRSPREAVGWLKRAAERADAENPHALHELGLLYESAQGNDNIVRDEGYALELFHQAADLGYKFSQFRLGAAYEYGNLGVAIDSRASIAWYSKAAVQDEHQSELALSGWYLTGSEGIVQQSDTEAYLWARKAASAGLAKAEYAMGYFTETGIGCAADLEAAKRWYWRAASQNFPKAKERLEDLRKGGARMQKSRVSRSAVHKNDQDCIVM